ncbi:MAG TPA: transposase, partial [Pyrinomonadaceae bacterium]|nr:transposase [Pyrinomonadaceae bacterium]
KAFLTMARKWSNLNLPGALHFCTGKFLNRLPVFTESACCTAFLDELKSLNQTWPAKLIAYVLMPDHFHFISNPRDGRIIEFMRDLKSRAAKRIVQSSKRFTFPLTEDGHQVWQESFKAMPLWTGWMIWQKINYIHKNPLKAKLVKSAKDYRWTSFRAFYSQSDEPLAVDREWAWPEDGEKLSKATKELGWYSFWKRRSDKKR